VTVKPAVPDGNEMGAPAVEFTLAPLPELMVTATGEQPVAMVNNAVKDRVVRLRLKAIFML